MICDTLEHLNRYRGFHENLDTAIDYLTAYCVGHTLADLPLGRTEVDGENVFIHVMEADLKPGEGANPEYHRRYADLQIDITGGEGWGYATAPGEEVGTFTGDIGFQNSPDAVTGSLGEGRFVLFFPGEQHKPGVARPECTKVRKAVVKIRMEDKA